MDSTERNILEFRYGGALTAIYDDGTVVTFNKALGKLGRAGGEPPKITAETPDDVVIEILGDLPSEYLNQALQFLGRTV